MFRFLIDENLPPGLAQHMRDAGIEAYHINEMKAHQRQKVSDDQLRRLTLQKDYIIVTKDDDFVKSYVSRKVPDKLIYLYGFSRKEQLMDRLLPLIPNLEFWISAHDFIEINPIEIKYPFSD